MSVSKLICGQRALKVTFAPSSLQGCHGANTTSQKEGTGEAMVCVCLWSWIVRTLKTRWNWLSFEGSVIIQPCLPEPYSGARTPVNHCWLFFIPGTESHIFTSGLRLTITLWGGYSYFKWGNRGFLLAARIRLAWNGTQWRWGFISTMFGKILM